MRSSDFDVLSCQGHLLFGCRPWAKNSKGLPFTPGKNNHRLTPVFAPPNLESLSLWEMFKTNASSKSSQVVWEKKTSSQVFWKKTSQVFWKTENKKKTSEGDQLAVLIFFQPKKNIEAGDVSFLPPWWPPRNPSLDIEKRDIFQRLNACVPPFNRPLKVINLEEKIILC